MSALVDMLMRIEFFRLSLDVQSARENSLGFKTDMDTQLHLIPDFHEIISNLDSLNLLDILPKLHVIFSAMLGNLGKG